jgi:two-component system cell cycle response regulator DivK
VARILLVEDNELNRDMLSRRLIRGGHQVSFALDGQQAVDLARAEQPDIVLMDMGLPVIDGWQATRMLRADPETAKLRIIALTSHAMSGDREQALAAGCDDYETKPIDLPRLLGKIAAQLRAGCQAAAKADEEPGS